MEMGNTLLFARFGERFKRLRRMMQHSFSAQNSLAYRGIQRGEVHILLHNILQEPDIFEKHIERFALYCWLIPWLICSLTIRAVSGSILMTAYGYQIESNEDEFVHLAKIVTDRVVALGSAGTTLVDFIPLCKYRILLPNYFHNQLKSTIHPNLDAGCWIQKTRFYYA